MHETTFQALAPNYFHQLKMDDCECLTQKCIEFIDTPIGGKAIEEVPGIGKVYGCRLRKAGLCKVIIASFSHLTSDVCTN